MITDLTTHAAVLAQCLDNGLRQRATRHARRRHDQSTVWSRRRRPDDGSTLEMVILVLGLMAIAGLLVAALTGAVTRMTNQIR